MKNETIYRYDSAVQQIKTAILRSQAKALSSVNQEQLALYYGIGRYLSRNSRSGFWGKEAIDTISRQLANEMPGLRGFSARNLRNMRTFYEQWKSLDTNLAVATAKTIAEKDQLSMPTIDVPVTAFFGIGFTHHIAILSGTKTIDERVIENGIVHNIRNFIMTFGKGFAFIGSQVHYDKLGHDHWVDILFFNRILQSLVVVELKKGVFKPGYLGQLSHYLHVLDDEERLEGENPPVGIVLCKDADRTFVEYVLHDYNRPMGVATYKLSQEKLKELWPDEEEMKKLM